MVGKKRKALAAQPKTKSTMANKTSRRGKTKEERRITKEQKRLGKGQTRKKDKNAYTAEMWAAPAPSHLVARLDVPKVKSKYQSYFEFAENTERREKKLEFQVTDEAKPPPGFAFVPIGDPVLTNACKELSRAQDAMIFIVSGHKEENSKISEHIYRTGYHFREMIVDAARDIVGETVIINPAITPGSIEPIPEAQNEINKQADGAIRDLFPRIPNTDRTMIIEHAFKKGALFHGEPTVGLQPNIPLSRRVQLAVLAHIRHTHTRYDKLLRETTWMNARKAVEPVCLDVLVKWRGDEETGRDQMDEILREVVIITDSEDEDSSSEEDNSDEDGELSSVSSEEAPLVQNSRDERASQPRNAASAGNFYEDLVREPPSVVAASSSNPQAYPRLMPSHGKKAQRGFKRYRAAWEEALNRQHESSTNLIRAHTSTPLNATATRRPAPTYYDLTQSPKDVLGTQSRTGHAHDYQSFHADSSTTRSGAHYAHPGRPSGLPVYDEVTVRPRVDRLMHYPDAPPRLANPPYQMRESGPPQVVGASSTRHGLQDMLVPSIETTSSDVVLPHLRERYDSHSQWENDSYTRREFEHRRPSPSHRQVIVINDDSPPVKRRRLVHEDDAGHFRPLPSHNQSNHAANQRFESSLMSASSLQPGNFFTRHPGVKQQSAQGSFSEISSGPSSAERLPVYDAPDSGYFTTHPSRLGRQEVGYGPRYRGQPHAIREQVSPPREFASERAIYRQQAHDYERDNVSGQPCSVQSREHRPLYSSTEMPSASRGPHSYDIAPGSVVADQDFIHSFSQSRLDGPSSRIRDGFTIISERPHQSLASQNNIPQDHEEYSARSFATIPPLQTRSPIRYMDRPLHPEDESHQYATRARPNPDSQASNYGTLFRSQQPLPAEEVPTFVRTLVPRRHVVVLD